MHCNPLLKQMLLNNQWIMYKQPYIMPCSIEFYNVMMQADILRLEYMRRVIRWRLLSELSHTIYAIEYAPGSSPSALIQSNDKVRRTWWILMKLSITNLITLRRATEQYAWIYEQMHLNLYDVLGLDGSYWFQFWCSSPQEPNIQQLYIYIYIELVNPFTFENISCIYVTAVGD